MSWLSKLAFWRDDEPEIAHIDGYKVEGCFVPNEVQPDTASIGDPACDIPDIGTITPPKSGPQ